MRLGGPDGAGIDLDIAGYEFPLDRLGPDPDEWDANWLVIRGRAWTCDGRSWAFRDPALVTWEAAELLDWLQDDARSTAPDLDVVLGRVTPPDGGPPWEDDPARGHWLAFTEPNLALATATSPGGLRLLVGLALECAAPEVRSGDAVGWSWLDLPWSGAAAAEAAADWARQLQAHPPR